MSDDTIMNEVDWKKDGEEGCLMALVKVTAGAVVLGVVLTAGYLFGHGILEHLWSK